MSKKLLFLSCTDTTDAERIAKLIEKSPEAKKNGLKVWFEKRDLKPGISWQDQVKEVIQNRSTAFAVYIGGNGSINWAGKDVKMALSRVKANPSYHFIPILTSRSISSRYLPPFARRYQSVKDVESNSEELSKFIAMAISTEKKASQNIVAMPFIGLRSFHESNANLFFGREKELEKLIEMLRKNRLVMLIGGSGSGKSSLVRAGLSPAFRSGVLGEPLGSYPDRSIWSVIGTRPGEKPFERLAYNINNVALEKGADVQTRDEIKDMVCSSQPENVYNAIVQAAPKKAKILMVVDHFEELFIDIKENVRQNYINCILHMIDEARSSKIYVVINIHYDYYNLCSKYKEFYKFLESRDKEAKFKLSMMGQEGLRACIEKPLEIGGVSNCDDFVNTVLDDAMSLPNDFALLQMALAESWRRRKEFRGDILKAYLSIGGISGVLAQASYDFYERLSDNEKALKKQIFLRLVHLDQTGKGASRIANKDEFTDDEWTLLQKFASEEFGCLILIKTNRIFTENDSHYEEETAEISNDALITHWPKYQAWIWDESDYKRIHDHVIVNSKIWQESEKKIRFLAKGNNLKEYVDLLSNRKMWLSKLERSFINSSRMLSIFTKSTFVMGIVLLVVGGITLSSLQMKRDEDKKVLTKYLMYEGKEGDTEAIQTFIKLGIDLNVRDAQGNTVLMYAAKEGHENAVKKLLEYRKIEYNAKNKNGETALMFAANSYEGVVRALLEKGADINAKNEQGETALMYVKNKKMAEFLLDKGLDGRFKIFDRGLLYDLENRVDWFSGPNKDMSWDDAHAWVDSLNRAKFAGGGWRLPKPVELKSLYKAGLGERNMVPFLSITTWWVWSDKAGDMLTYKGFNFGIGKGVYNQRTFSKDYRAFAVRSDRR